MPSSEWATQKIIGFAPDLPPDTPGIVTYAQGVVPTERGLASSATVATLSPDFFSAVPTSGAVLTQQDGITRTFGGLNDKIYEVDAAGNLTQRLSVVGASAEWMFAQMGSLALAQDKGAGLYSSALGANFAAVAAAPKASILVTPSLPEKQFAMLFGYDNTAHGGDALGDGVFWSAANDCTNWTPDIATECGNNQITDLGGPFTAAIPYRDGVVAFKARGMYLGTYVGGSGVWGFERISADVGCIGKHAVVQANDALYFADATGLWEFDGTYPKLMPGYVHRYWANIVATNDLAGSTQVRLTWDKGRQRLFVAYPDGGIASFMAFQLRSQLWTQHGYLTSSDGTLKVGLMIGADAALGIAPSAKFLSLDWDGIAPQAATVRFGAMGTLGEQLVCRGVRPQWLTAPTGFASGRLYYGPTLRTVLNANTPMVQNGEGGFDVVFGSRYLQPEITSNAGTVWEMSAFAVDLQEAGNY